MLIWSLLVKVYIIYTPVRYSNLTGFIYMTWNKNKIKFWKKYKYYNRNTFSKGWQYPGLAWTNTKQYQHNLPCPFISKEEQSHHKIYIHRIKMTMVNFKQREKGKETILRQINARNPHQILYPLWENGAKGWELRNHSLLILPKRKHFCTSGVDTLPPSAVAWFDSFSTPNAECCFVWAGRLFHTLLLWIHCLACQLETNLSYS